MIREADKRDVLLANLRLYDAVAEHYEELDGRRSPVLKKWLTGILINLRKSTGPRLLDIGSGSGLISGQAEKIFEQRVAMDISHRILALHKSCFDHGFAGDVDAIPLVDNSIDAIVCFAVLHHLYDFKKLAAEAGRVLRPGGIFYSDHDMDRLFHDRFRLPLSIYRKIKNSDGKYTAIKGITQREYTLAEWQEHGIDSIDLTKVFKDQGFSVSMTFHWYGLSPVSDAIFGKRPLSHGLAPLIRMCAIKR